ncbi:MAG TPA: nitroreductase family protein [Pilimelia sp.]|nr:nitroreductase family protein [Pilimelia sp.]
MHAASGVVRPSNRVIAACLEAAVAAPSVMNTQPWRFRVRRTGIDVFVDRARQLPVADPDGREMFISVGAALLNLRLALLEHGCQPVIRRSPGGHGDPVATIGFGPPAAPDATVRALVGAIGRRHTNRRPYAELVVPVSVLDELRAAATTEGAVISLVHPASRNAILSLARCADEQLRGDEQYLRELAGWVHPAAGRGDGLTAAALGAVDAAGVIPLRDTGTQDLTSAVRFESHPTLLILSTAGDASPDWLRAGQALQRCLLTATVRQLAAQPITQPLEVTPLRQLLTDLAAHRHPQMILRVGYAKPVPVTPRRPLQHALVSDSGQQVTS